MNTDNNQVVLTCQANGAVTHRAALKVTGQVNGLLDVSIATAATDKVIGFALEGAADNTLLRVCVAGVCEAIATTTITAGTHEFLTAAADGELTPYAVADRPVAYYLGAKKGSATAAANDVINVLVLHAPVDTIV